MFDRDPRSTAGFCCAVSKTLGARLKMSTSDHPESHGQTERANRFLEKILREYVHSFTNWSELMPMLKFAINSSVHVSTTHTLFLVNGLRYSRLPTLLERDYRLRGGLLQENANSTLTYHVLSMRVLRTMSMLTT